MKILKTLRDKSGLTLRQVEEATSLSNAYLSQLEGGKVKNPSAKHLYLLSKLYSVTIEYLLQDADWLNEKQIIPVKMKPSIDEKLADIDRRLNKLELRNIVFGQPAV